MRTANKTRKFCHKAKFDAQCLTHQNRPPNHNRRLMNVRCKLRCQA